TLRNHNSSFGAPDGCQDGDDAQADRREASPHRLMISRRWRRATALFSPVVAMVECCVTGSMPGSRGGTPMPGPAYAPGFHSGSFGSSSVKPFWLVGACW